jgi:hypothetical protein
MAEGGVVEQSCSLHGTKKQMQTEEEAGESFQGMPPMTYVFLTRPHLLYPSPSCNAIKGLTS